jgi:hypothetical protein
MGIQFVRPITGNESFYECQDRGDGTAAVSALYIVNDLNDTGVQWAIDTFGGTVPGAKMLTIRSEVTALWWEPTDDGQAGAQQAMAKGMLGHGISIGRWSVPAKILQLLGMV